MRCMVVLLFLVNGQVRAQSLAQWIAWGDAAVERGEYYGASRFYAGALELDPGRMSLQWKQAEACRLSLQYDRAAALYERIHSKDHGRTHPDALRWSAEMQMCEGRHQTAMDTWKKVLEREKDPTSFTSIRANNAIKGCELSRELTPLRPGTTIEHLPGPVNTFDSEFAARLAPDGSLWFTSLRGALNEDDEVLDTAHYHPALYATRSVGAAWADPVRAGSIDPRTGMANATWSVDGSRLYFTRIGNDGSSGLMSITADSAIHAIVGMPEGANATQPWVAELDGREVMFFASAGLNGLGGMDIWLADLHGDSLTDLRNAGPFVNSIGNETTPSFDPVDGVLWFSSDLLPGLGGYDVFRSAWVNGAFQQAENARAPINSPANDLYASFDPSIGEGWLTSNRKGSFAAKGETCCNDIYHLRIPPSLPIAQTNDTIDRAGGSLLQGSTETSLQRLQAEFPLKLYFHNDEPDPRTRATRTGQTYGATFDAYRELFDTYRQVNADRTAIDTFIAEEAEKGRAQLDEMVDALLPLLENGAQLTLDVRGHASPLALNDYNRNLSMRRIESLRNHLYRSHDGRLHQFMDSTANNGGVLRLRVLPLGEERSAAGVSDDRNDIRHSVFSVEAARERRIEVERVHGIDPGIRFVGGRANADIGTVRQGEARTFLLPLRNEGTTVLTITNGLTSCDCFQVQQLPPPIPAGGTGVLEVLYTGRTRPGPLERTIQLIAEGAPSQLELIIKGLVID